MVKRKKSTKALSTQRNTKKPLVKLSDLSALVVIVFLALVCQWGVKFPKTLFSWEDKSRQLAASKAKTHIEILFKKCKPGRFQSFL